MKKNLGICFLSLILINSCARPKVVNVISPEDKKLNCEKLESSLDNALEFRRKALAELGNTGANQVRGLLFWPALFATYANAHEAVLAASERSVHIINIMQNKNCEKVDIHLANIQRTLRVQTLRDLSEAYKNLNELYKSGAISEEEYTTAKRKVLGQ